MKILTFVFILFSYLTKAQVKLVINPETSRYEAVDVVSIERTGANELYTKSLEWVALRYKSAQDVIQFKDEDNKKIILKASFAVNLFGKSGWIKHTLTLEFKENRFRYHYTDLSYYSSGSGEIPFEARMISKKTVLSVTENRIAESILSLRKNFIKNANDEW